jgi:hypothetical protein
VNKVTNDFIEKVCDAILHWYVTPDKSTLDRMVGLISSTLSILDNGHTNVLSDFLVNSILHHEARPYIVRKVDEKGEEGENIAGNLRNIFYQKWWEFYFEDNIEILKQDLDKINEASALLRDWSRKYELPVNPHVEILERMKEFEYTASGLCYLLEREWEKNGGMPKDAEDIYIEACKTLARVPLFSGEENKEA